MTQVLFKNTTMIADRYRIDAFVAEGGMQQVFHAFDMRLNREVALKTPINNSGLKRFKKSASLSAKVTHPNTAKTLDFFEFQDRQFLVEEFIEGMNLRDRCIRDFDFIDPVFACYLTHRIARGVAASHHAGVFHRDLKPSNIMVSNEAQPEVLKITDFGIAKMAAQEIEEVFKTREGDERTLAIEQSKTVKGLFPYMSPELLQNESPGLPADVWSVGAIGYELLTGVKPYGEGISAIAKIVSGKLPSKPVPKNQNIQFSTLSEELWNVLLKCFLFDPAKRISADQLVQEFGRLCYSSAPRSEGTIASYGVFRGNHGFIRRGTDEIFFHRDSFYGNALQAGQRVIFSDYPGTPNPRAHPVLPLKAQ